MASITLRTYENGSRGVELRDDSVFRVFAYEESGGVAYPYFNGSYESLEKAVRAFRRQVRKIEEDAE